MRDLFKSKLQCSILYFVKNHPDCHRTSVKCPCGFINFKSDSCSWCSAHYWSNTCTSTGLALFGVFITALLIWRLRLSESVSPKAPLCPRFVDTSNLDFLSSSLRGETLGIQINVLQLFPLILPSAQFLQIYLNLVITA